MGFWFSLTYYLVLVLVVIYAYFKLSWNWCRSATCLVGKTTLVTGANTGIGYETALEFAKRGAKVIVACRNENKAKEVVDRIAKETGNQLVSYGLVDFSEFSSVKKFAKEINETQDRLDILVNNAGAGILSGKSTDGHNLLMQTNYYGPFLLTVLLLDLIKKTPAARIVNVSSVAAKYGKINFDTMDEVVFGWKASSVLYATSKFCNILFTLELAYKLKGSGVTTYSLHPGTVNTEIFRSAPALSNFIKHTILHLYFKTPLEGCQTTLYCSLQKGLEEYNGEHFANCGFEGRYESVTKAIVEDPQITKKLWEVTEKIVGLEK